MAIYTLLDAVTSGGAGTAQGIDARERRKSTDGIAQCIFTGTATIDLEGSLDGTNWFMVFTIDSTDAEHALAVMIPPWVRGNVTSYGSGACSLLLELNEDI